MKRTINIKKYLGESEELKSLVKDNNLYIISGCGTGKTYFIGEYIMKEYKTLTINFLNIVNLQSYKKYYGNGLDYTGEKSMAINVEQIKNISDEALEKTEVIVIDEIQLHHISADFRLSSGDLLRDFINKCNQLGKRLILITGTPLPLNLGAKYNLDTIIVKKDELNTNDEYLFNFIEGLTERNVFKFILDDITHGIKVIIKSDKHIDLLEKLAIKNNVRYEKLCSSAKEIEGTATNYILKNSLLPDNIDLFITTKVLVEGVNINDTEKVKIYSFVDDIESPMSAIQLASRLRKQPKNLTLGYRNDDDFNINYKRCGFSDILESEVLGERDFILSQFNNKVNWKEYITKFCTLSATCYIEDEKVFVKADSIKDDEVLPLEYKEIAKLILEDIKKVDKYYFQLDKPFTKYYKVHNNIKNEVEIIDAPNGNNYKWLLTPIKVNNIKNMLRLMDKGFNIESMENEEVETLLRVSYTAHLFSKALDQKGNENERSNYYNGVLDCRKDDVHKTTINKLLSSRFKIVENGKIKLINSKDDDKYINNHIELINDFYDTIRNIILDIKVTANPFVKLVTINDIYNNELKAYNIKLNGIKASISSKKSKGGKATKTITLVNDSIGFSMVFNSSKDCDNFVVTSLGFTKREKERLRNSEVKGYKRI